jgi:3',5'-nucleoside bisphosphate phosphatase
MPADLHTHSRASDGMDTPAEVVAVAHAAGLAALALTDHDTTAGWSEAAAALRPGMTLVPGIELSATAEGLSVHMLAYLPDPTDPALTAEMSAVRDDRVPRLRRMVDLLQADGVPISWEQVLAQTADGATVGRPHLADALVAAGIVPDRGAAFDGYLHARGPYYVRHYAVPALRSVQLVRGAGGVPVIAHPAAAQRGKIVGDDVLAELAAAGLAGLEVDHRDHDVATRRRLRGLAAELGLLVTGSSDYHGAGKPNRIGENTTQDEMLEALVAQATSGVAPVTA